MGEKLSRVKKAGDSADSRQAGIPVTVQAAYDAENLYMKFTWPETAHAPVNLRRRR